MRDTITVQAELYRKLWQFGASDTLLGEHFKEGQRLAELVRVPRIHIHGTRWTQRSTGNTYHKVYIDANGERIGECGPTYGSGDQYLYTALAWLKMNRPDLIPDYGGVSINPTIYLREIIQGSWSVQDVSRERDL